MSHYSKLKTKIKDRAALVAALEELGFAGKVEVHEVATHLQGYGGDLRPEVANIILRRMSVGGASNDIGFVLREDGTYEAIISEYDRNNGASRKNKLTENTAGYNASWLEMLNMRYSSQVIKQQANELGFAYSEETEGDELVITIDGGY